MVAQRRAQAQPRDQHGLDRPPQEVMGAIRQAAAEVPDWVCNMGAAACDKE
jgi:hypothetical protein